MQRSSATTSIFAVMELRMKNLKGAFAPQGSVAQLRGLLGLDAAGVAESVLDMLHLSKKLR